MRLVIFGLSITSSWGNGHATSWRALCRSLARRGHRVTFFERDQPSYRLHRDLDWLPDHDLQVYGDWSDIAAKARREVREADAVIVTSTCADAREASAVARAEAPGLRVFYDMDTPVTLERLRMGEPATCLVPQGLNDFDLVLSTAGGPALGALRRHLGARRTEPLYGCVDPDDYPVWEGSRNAALTYLGTYAPDREAAFDRLLLKTAHAEPQESFVVGGPHFPNIDSWPTNVEHHPYVGQPQHAAFYGRGKFTLNLTRGAMGAWGYCPSGRLFEAAACGTPILTDEWPGLAEFFEPGDEVTVVHSADDVRDALRMTDAERRRMALRARERVLETCTSDVRAGDLERVLASDGGMVGSVSLLPRVAEMPVCIGA